MNKGGLGTIIEGSGSEEASQDKEYEQKSKEMKIK
jgi:hypothetical protein